MKKAVIFLTAVILVLALYTGFSSLKKTPLISPLGKQITEKPLEKYTFEALRKKKFGGSLITIGKVLKEGENFTSYLFFFKDGGKKVSGLLNVPKKRGTYPLIVMFRGYVDKEKYTTGEGTRHAGEFFASPPAGGGFITIAPDFLGYGQSDNPSKDSIEERFQTYTTALTLLNSIGNLNESFGRQCHAEFISASPQNKILKPIRQTQGEQVQDDNLCNIKVDTQKVGIWGHSNGGHISLSVLEITGKAYPTVLWAPVSKPFPYSILYFTDEFDDHGKALRRAVANFEKDYDIEKYSPSNFFDWINSPLQIYQGGADEAVPQKWSDQLVSALKNLKKDVSYLVYPNEDHNFSNGSWSDIAAQSLNFYRNQLSK